MKFHFAHIADWYLELFRVQRHRDDIRRAWLAYARVCDNEKMPAQDPGRLT